MTLRRTPIAAFALVFIAAPAFAHGSGHGGMSFGDNHMSTPQQNDHNSNHMTSNKTNNTVVTPKNVQQTLNNVTTTLRPLAQKLKMDLMSGNKGDARRVLREIQQLSRIVAGLKFNIATSAGPDHSIMIGSRGVTIDGKPVRI